jgi:hypothetical protein
MGNSAKHTTGTLEGTQLVASQRQGFREQGAIHTEVSLEKQNSSGSTVNLQPSSIFNKLFFLPEIESLFYVKSI